MPWRHPVSSRPLLAAAIINRRAQDGLAKHGAGAFRQCQWAWGGCSMDGQQAGRAERRAAMGATSWLEMRLVLREPVAMVGLRLAMDGSEGPADEGDGDGMRVGLGGGCGAELSRSHTHRHEGLASQLLSSAAAAALSLGQLRA